SVSGEAAPVGAVVQLVPDKEGNWSLGKYFDFNTSDGGHPTAGVVIDSAGDLFGTTSQDGQGYGTVFELKPKGNSFTETVIHRFSGNKDGAFPHGSLIIGRNG